VKITENTKGLNGSVDCVDTDELKQLKQDNASIREALECIISVVGLTAFKYEDQRAVLQESIDMGNSALKAVRG